MITQQPLQPAQLQWQDDIPEAFLFGDIYFSRENGLEESNHVFLQGNQLTTRFLALKPDDTFVIGETGFGTGLNFLLAWQLWQHTAPATAQLFFISTELHPFTVADLHRALSSWPDLHKHAAALLAHYPLLTPGFHWLRIAENVTLLLLFGDARSTLPQLHDSAHSAFHTENPWQVNAWFLDGFAPAKNPQLWQTDLFSTIATLSTAGTTLASFTAAGDVRRGLIAQGFDVQKVPGYGRKREMITASFTALPEQKNTFDKTPWLLNNTAKKRGKNIIVIGGGLAGCHVARTLAERGCYVTLVEQHDALATEASGNTQGALYTKLSANNAPLTQFGLSSLQYATRHYQQAFLQTVFERCGVLQLTDNKDETLQSLFQHNQDYLQWLDVDAASTIAGVTVAEGGWWLPHTGWLAPRAVCAALVQHGNITVLHQRADTLMQVGEHWQVYLSNEKKSLEADHIVIACANSSKQFAQTEWLPLRPVRGQISLLPATPLSRHLRCVVCAEGYLAPAHLGQHCLGASFVPGDTSTAVRDTEHTHNIGLLTAISPVLHTEWLAASEGRAGVRTTAADHLPLVGAMPDREAFLNNYATLRHNAKAVIASPGSYVSGLSLFTAFGGRGLCYIPLAAELLCSQLLQQPRPVSRELQMALAPARCVVRELIRTHAGR